MFTQNRDRLIEGDIARKFMATVLDHGPVRAPLSDDHFSVDGTLIEAWASMKTFRPKDGSSEQPAPGRNGERDFHGEKRSNEMHASTTDPVNVPATSDEHSNWRRYLSMTLEELAFRLCFIDTAEIFRAERGDGNPGQSSGHV